MENNFATLESQINNEPCNVEDTEEIFWLKMADDYQSKVKAGDLLVKQYRFKDAIKEYQNACNIKNGDPVLYIKLGGAYLTIFNFERAITYYNKALECGAKEENVAFYFGIKEYLQGNFFEAIKNFEKTKIDNDEMLIAVIYWHTIASFRIGIKPSLLEKYNENMNVGHHTAYKTVVSLFDGQVALSDVIIPKSSLDATIVLYGIYEYSKHIKQTNDSDVYMQQLLTHTDVWPCIAYLAAYNDR